MAVQPEQSAATARPVADRDFERFCDQIRRLWRIDLRAYNSGQLQRRLTGMMTRAGATTLAEFARKLERDPQLSADLLERFTINVTRFFRDEHLYGRLEALLQADGLAGRIRQVWSAGCSIGMEPYSLAMILSELAPNGSWQIEATDIDEGALSRARAGVYEAEQVRDVPKARLAQAFEQRKDGTFAVKPHLKRRVRFSALDLLDARGKEPRGCDLILCRNVVIYFTPEAKVGVYALLTRSLRPGGLLFVGATERVPPEHAAQYLSLGPFLYQKRAAA